MAPMSLDGRTKARGAGCRGPEQASRPGQITLESLAGCAAAGAAGCCGKGNGARAGAARPASDTKVI